MFISVIIPAYNEERLLPRALAALLPQAKACGAEVIVIDNNSTDRTAMVALRAGAHVIRERRAGYVFALQRGLNEARGDIAAYTDADSVVGSRWLSAIIEAFRDPGVVSATGPVRFERLRWLSWFHVLFRRILLGSNMAVRRQAALAAGGFNPRFNLGSDVALGWAVAKLGRLAYQPEMRVTTSARRFQAHPYREGLRYIANHVWMAAFHQPLFWHFAAIRQSPEELARHERRHLWFTSLTLAAIVLIYLSIWPTSSDFGQVMVHGRTRSREVALTFDDGPNGTATRRIVDILVANRVPATFFEVGRNVAADPATVKYVSDHGLNIGNHSWDHSYRLPYFSPKHILQELTKTSDVIAATTGRRPQFFRPPHGFRSPQLLYEARRARLRVIDWNIDPQDYLASRPALITKRVLKDLPGGSIILLHDGLQDGPRARQSIDRRGTIAALPTIIGVLRRRGYVFISLDQLWQEGRQHGFGRFFRRSIRQTLTL